ncbi:MAG: hypothetical protein JJU29_09550 [Verrucomicrobia bacterium]|nr:hypothetical protein [Verrucomicrobiota bacterium]MCH8513579.1 hypothetical protein [Kiritimatiellia bacterium]
MSDDLPSDSKLICPSCFARDVDPVMLRRDAANGEYYCVFCAYIAKGKPDVVRFMQDVVRHKYGIERAGF